MTRFSDGTLNDTGRMFFLDTRSGGKLSHFMIPRPEPGVYCSAHLGKPVPNRDGRNLLVNAWYEGGVDVIDFTDPTDPEEIAFYDAASDNWSAYWYEGPELPGDTLTIYGNDIRQGFQSFRGDVAVDDTRLPFLNPQTQMETVGAGPRRPRGWPKR